MAQHRSRRSHARSDLARILRGAMEVVVLALATLTPWAFGGVDPVFEFAIAGTLALLLALWAALTIVSGKLTFVRCPVTLVLALIFIVGLLQLLPMPSGLLTFVSPGAADIRASFYPAQPEKLTDTLTAAGAPAMPTISVYPYATRTELFHWLAVLVLFAAVRNQIASTGSLWRLSLILVINGCLLALFGLVQFFRMKTRGTVYGAYAAAQPFGPFINRNHFAAYLNICIGLGVGLLVWLGPSKEDRKQRYMVKPNAQEEQREVLSVVFSPLIVLHSPPQLWTCVGLALMFGSLMVSLSRGGVAAIFLGVIATLCLRLTWPIRIRRLEALIVPILLILALFAWVGFRPFETRLGSLLQGTTAVGDTRLPIWNDIVKLVPRFWLLGSGYGTLGYVEPLTRSPGTFPDPAIFVDHAHNDYLEALVEGGIVRAGLTLLLVGLVFAAGFGALRRYSSRTPGALAVGAMTGFLAIALHSAVDFSITTPAVAIVTAIVVAQLLALNRSDPTKPPAHDHSHVDAISLGPVRSLAVGLTAFLLGGLLVAHFWQIDRVHRLKLIAFHAVHMANPPAYDVAIQYLQAAERLTPDDAELRSDRGQALLDLAPEVRAPFLNSVRQEDSVRRNDYLRLAALATCTDNGFGTALALATWHELPRPTVDRLPAAGKKAVLQKSVLPALEEFAIARELCPLLPRPQMRFAAHAVELVAADKPRQYWDRAIRLATTDPDLYYFAGLQALSDGRQEDAWADFRTALDLSPWPIYSDKQKKHLDRLQEIVNAALPHFGPDPRQRADQLLNRILPDRPEDLEAAARMVDPALSPTGPARPLLERALALLADRPEVLTPEEQHFKALIYRALGQPEAASKAYGLALNLAPNQTGWRVEWARFLMEQRQWKEAHRQLLMLPLGVRESPEVKNWIEQVEREEKIDLTAP